MTEALLTRPENLTSPEKQSEQIDQIVTHDSSFYAGQAVDEFVFFKDIQNDLEQNEIRDLLERNKRGEDLKYEEIQRYSNAARQEFWNQWVIDHIADYEGRDETAQEQIIEKKWIESNKAWIKQSTADTNNADIIRHRKVALEAVGIHLPVAQRNEIEPTPDQVLDFELRRFKQTYGDDEHGVQMFIQKIAESCRTIPGNKNSEFNLDDFNQRINAMEDFFVNFGEEYDGERIQDMMKDYLRAYVILETPANSPQKREMVNKVVSTLSQENPDTAGHSAPHPLPPGEDRKEEEEQSEVQQPLESGKRYTLQEIMNLIGGRPQRTTPSGEGNPYWISDQLLLDAVSSLSQAELAQLITHEPFFTNAIIKADGSMNWNTNRNVFEPAHIFRPEHNRNTRFARAEAATNNDSGTLALAAASAPDSGSQAEYYQSFMNGVLAVHEMNLSTPPIAEGFPNTVLAKFIIDQTQLLPNEQHAALPPGENRATALFVFQNNEITNALATLHITPGQPLSPEQTRARDAILTADLQEDSGRLIVFSPNSNDNSQLVPDLARTLQGWEKRMPKLKEAIQQGNLTPEQIRQLEFLAHAVDAKKLVEIMQKQTVEPVNPPKQETTGPEREEVKVSVLVGKESLGHNIPNEDSMFVRADKKVFGVFDGMGGHAAGETASSTAADFVGKELVKLPDNISQEDAQLELARILTEANAAVRTKSETKEEYNGMGTTASIGKVLLDGTAVIANVGDSRVYVLRQGQTVAEPLTLDDGILRKQHKDDLALAMEKQKRVGLAKSPDDLPADATVTEKILFARTGPLSNYAAGISQALGNENITPRIYTVKLETGDRLIFTSDGIHDNLTDIEIGESASSAENPQKAATAIVRKAKETSDLFGQEKDEMFLAPRAKPDDQTAIVVEVKIEKKPKKEKTEIKKQKTTLVEPEKSFEEMTPQERAAKFREWYTVDLKIMGEINKWLGKDINSDERARRNLENLIRQALEQRHISNIPTTLTEMRQVWGERRSREIEQVLREAGDSASYERFQEDHPYLALSPTADFDKLPDVQIINNRKVIEEHTGRTENISIVTVEDKGEDTSGIRVNADGTISIGIADGVSNSGIPKVASRVAIDAALQELESSDPSLATIEAAHNGIQQQNLAIMATSYGFFLEEKRRSLDTSDPLYQQKSIAVNAQITNFRSRLQQSISTTTLALAKYNQKQEKVDIALRGDSRVVVFHADGTFNIYEGMKNAPQIAYYNTPHTPFIPYGEVIQSIHLDTNDVVLVSSDGLKSEHLAKANKHLVEIRSRGETDRLDKQIAGFLSEIIKNEQLDDDVSIVTLQHTKAESKSIADKEKALEFSQIPPGNLGDFYRLFNNVVEEVAHEGENIAAERTALALFCQGLNLEQNQIMQILNLAMGRTVSPELTTALAEEIQQGEGGMAERVLARLGPDRQAEIQNNLLQIGIATGYLKPDGSAQEPDSPEVQQSRQILELANHLYPEQHLTLEDLLSESKLNEILDAQINLFAQASEREQGRTRNIILGNYSREEQLTNLRAILENTRYLRDEEHRTQLQTAIDQLRRRLTEQQLFISTDPEHLSEPGIHRGGGNTLFVNILTPYEQLVQEANEYNRIPQGRLNEFFNSFNRLSHQPSMTGRNYAEALSNLRNTCRGLEQARIEQIVELARDGRDLAGIIAREVNRTDTEEDIVARIVNALPTDKEQRAQMEKQLIELMAAIGHGPEKKEKQQQAWRVLGESIRGNEHVLHNKERQDSLEKVVLDNGDAIVAVADGHGSDAYFRSAKGANFATQVAVEIFTEISQRAHTSTGRIGLPEYVKKQVGQEILTRWKKKVDEDLEQEANALTEEELIRAIPNEKDRQKVRSNKYVAYGSTISVAASINGREVFLQLGDGDILITEVDPQSGNVQTHEALPSDPTQLANETRSLCTDTADKFRIVITPPGNANTKPMITVSTDGLSNSFTTSEGFLKVATDLYKLSDEEITTNLKTWLETYSKNGSGDDISLGILRQ